MSTVTVSIRLDAELAERLNTAADDRVVSKSLLARKAIAYYLDHLPETDLPSIRPKPLGQLPGELRTLRQSSTFTPPTLSERFRQRWES